MQVLVALAQASNRVVSRHELVVRCWNGLSVGEDAIWRCISKLRQLVSGWPQAPFGIETVVGVGYRLDAATAAPAAPRSAPPPSRPSIAVTPFANLSNNGDQDYFADGMVEEIVASLVRFKTIRVIWAGASVALNGQRVSPTEAARELGVDYLLEGSVRREQDRLRISVRLIEGASAAQLWSDRIEGPPTDLFALQDQVAERVAGAIDPLVQEIAVETAIRRPTANLDSYDLYLRSLPPFRLSEKAPMFAAIELLEQSLEMDPGFALALGQSAICHRQVVDHDWSDKPEFYHRRGLDYAERALAAAPDDAKVIAFVAAALPGLDGRTERALALADRAISLNPASTFVWLISGSVRLRYGDTDLAAEHLETALRLDPISPMGSFARMYLAVCRFQQKRFVEALALFDTTTFRLPISYAVLAALYGQLGRREEARDALATFDGVSAGTAEKFARLWFPRPESRRLFLDGLRTAVSGALRAV